MNIKDYLLSKKENIIKVKITPKSSKNELFSVLDDWTLKIRIKAVPEKWKANKELINYISSELSISKENIKIISWLTDQVKLIKINY